MKKNRIVEGLSCLFIILWLYTSLSKYAAFATFKRDMLNQPFPDWFAFTVIASLPVIEIATAALLFFDKTRKTGLYASLVLMILFTAYTITILAGTFNYIPCGCGGIIRSLNWWQHLAFNVFFTALAITGIYLYRKNLNKDIVCKQRELPKTLTTE